MKTIRLILVMGWMSVEWGSLCASPEASGVFTNVSETLDENYGVVYELDLPATGGFRDASSIAYLADNSATLFDFDRVAYYLELTGESGTSWIYVSMEAFSQDVKALALPHNVENPVVHQRTVRNMNVYSNVDGITTGTFIDTGNIEIWPSDSSPGQAFSRDDLPHLSYGVFGASEQLLDWGDGLGTTDAGHGSFQVHNALAGQTLLAYNGWGNLEGVATDIGIGNQHTGQPDWNYAANAEEFISRKLVILVRPRTYKVTFSELPRDRQLYPRDVATSTAELSFAGEETYGGYDRIVIRAYRAGALHGEFDQPLSYEEGIASFAFVVEIAAELAKYDFELLLEKGDEQTLVERVKDIVAGDAYLFYGQSNAEAKQWHTSESANEYASEWLLTFGQNSTFASKTQNILYWVQADGNAGREEPGGIGQWAMVIGRELVDAYEIPIVILNGAMGGYRMSRLQKDRNNPSLLHDTRSIRRPYNRLYYRAMEAGVADAARALFFYQGENDANDGQAHRDGYARLRQDWEMDYPGLEWFYVNQVRPGCGPVTREDVALRDIQRQMEDLYPRTSVMATNGLASHDGCHFGFTEGYEKLGRHHFRQVARDLYGAPHDPEIDALRPYRVLFSNLDRTELQIVMRNQGALIHFPEGALDDFALVGSDVIIVTRSVSDNIISLQLDQPAMLGDTLEYFGRSYDGEWVTNGNGVGLLAFSLPVREAGFPPSGGYFLVVENPTPLANGEDAALLTLQLRDDAGEPIHEADVAVTFSTSFGYFSGGDQMTELPTNEYGRVTVELISSLPGDAEVTVSVEGAATGVTGSPASVSFRSIEATEGLLVRLGSGHEGIYVGEPFPLEVTLLDDTGQPMAAPGDVEIVIIVEVGEGTLGGNSTMIIPDGEMTVFVAGLTYSRPEEQVVFRARIVGGAAGRGSGETVVQSSFPVMVAVGSSAFHGGMTGPAAVVRIDALVYAAPETPREGQALGGVAVFLDGGGEAGGTFSNGSSMMEGVTDESGMFSEIYFVGSRTGVSERILAGLAISDRFGETLVLGVVNLRTYVFDFGSDKIGAPPAYISMPWKQADMHVVESEWATNGRALRIDPYGQKNSDNAFFAAVFDDVPDSTEVEILIRMRDSGESSSLHWMTGAGARIRGIAGAETAVFAQSRGGETGLVLSRVNKGDFVDGFTHFSYPKGEFMRARWNGETVSAKMWNGSLADEPEEWLVENHELSAPTRGPGRVGITRFFSRHRTEIDFLNVAVFDPLPPSIPQEIRLTSPDQTGTVGAFVILNVELRDAEGQPVSSSGTTAISLRSDSNGIFFEITDGSEIASVDIPNGSSGATFHYIPLAGGVHEILAETDGLTRGTTSVQSIFTFGAWQKVVFPPESRGDDAISGPLVKRGGIANLLRYAFSLGLESPGEGALPLVSLHEDGTGSFLQIRYAMQHSAEDLVYSVEASDDLAGWETLPDSQIVEVQSMGNGIVYRVVRDTSSIMDSSRRFLRVKVELIDTTD